MIITDKVSQTHHWRLGLFGNKLRTWSRPEDIPKALRNSGHFSLRALVPGGKFQHHLDFFTMRNRWTPDYYICEPVDAENLLIQGELWMGIGGYEAFYSHTPGFTCREAMTVPGLMQWAQGMRAKLMFQAELSPYSWDDVQKIFEEWPNAIIELSCFDHDLGEMPCRNTIIWEVRGACSLGDSPSRLPITPKTGY